MDHTFYNNNDTGDLHPETVSSALLHTDYREAAAKRLNRYATLNGLDSDQDRRSVGPDLNPNCLQLTGTRLSTDTFIKVRKRANIRNQYNQAPRLTQDTRCIRG